MPRMNRPTAPAEKDSTNAKLLVARAAVKLIQSGMTVGLGSGSTATLFIQELGRAIEAGTLNSIVGIPTSQESERLARSVGIAVGDFSSRERCDITVDGADEIDNRLDCIKGLGGALLREKLVAQNSEKLVIIVDHSKRVPKLCTKGPLPIEVTPFGLAAHDRFLRSLGATPKLRIVKDSGSPYLTDNGNNIFDCRFDAGLLDARLFALRVQERAGIVEHGLFLSMVSTLLSTTSDGRVETFGKKS